ncbi:MAG: hypothetical protein V2I33_26335 [Kangiellaceae bacterium]|nr:hypothetical protein [Kangiellaceae bacterium]
MNPIELQAEIAMATCVALNGIRGRALEASREIKAATPEKKR